MLYTVLQAQESASEYVFVGFSLNHFGWDGGVSFWDCHSTPVSKYSFCYVR